MASNLFLDANIPLYASGRPHPLKEPSRTILRLVADYGSAFITDAEVLQEILHRYVAIQEWTRGSIVFTEFANLLKGRVEPVYVDDVEAAADLAGQYVGLSARDLIHVAVMQRLGLDSIVSADQGFDRVGEYPKAGPGELGGLAERGRGVGNAFLRRTPGGAYE